MGFRKIALCFAGDEEIAAMAELAAPLTPEKHRFGFKLF